MDNSTSHIGAELGVSPDLLYLFLISRTLGYTIVRRNDLALGRIFGGLCQVRRNLTLWPNATARAVASRPVHAAE